MEVFTPDLDVTRSINPEAGNNSHDKSIDDKQRESFNTLFSTAAVDLNNVNIERLPTGCKSLDDLLGNGMETGVITQFYGAPGSGKTQLCFTLCVTLPSHYRAIYIDTESSFRPERIKAIARARGLDHEKILQRILVAKALDSTLQESCIEVAASNINFEANSIPNNIKLLIVDSMTGHHRAEYAGRSRLPERLQKLNRLMHMLLKIVHTNAVAVVVTNHEMQSSVDGSFDKRVVPLGGNVMSYASTYRIHLDGRYPDCRRARLELSPCHPQADILFAIDDRGFTDVGDDTSYSISRTII
jgi:DNA repair protein RadA